MYPSDRFLSRIARIRKTGRGKSAEAQIESIRTTFLDATRVVPERLAQAVFDEFGSTLMEGDGETVFDRCQVMGDLVDVLHCQYDEENDPLDTGQWALISSVVSEFALDMEMGFVSYIMSHALDHHAV